VINLPEADVARYFCSDVINRVFKIRKGSFTLIPKVVFVFDEAQEFIPFEAQDYGISLLSADYFKKHTSKDRDLEDWKNGFSFNLKDF
jgi:hypothetical protein